MIRRQLVNLGGFGCDYRIGCGALEEFSRFAANVVTTPKRAVLVIEPGVADSTLTLVDRGLVDAGFRVSIMQLAADDAVCTVDCAQPKTGMPYLQPASTLDVLAAPAT